jgi:hypothetical protein
MSASKELLLAIGTAGIVSATAITAYMFRKTRDDFYFSLGFSSVAAIAGMTIVYMPELSDVI